MWYAISFDSSESQKSILKQLNRAGVLAAEACTLTLNGVPITNALVFPEDDLPKVLKALGLDLPMPSTPTDDPRFRLLVWPPVLALLPPGEDAAAVRATLKPYAEELDLHIMVTNAHGGCVPACGDRGILRIHTYSAPPAPAGAQQGIPGCQIASAFGNALPPGVSDGLTPRGLGLLLKTPEGAAIAEAVEGTLYVLADITHPCPGSGDLIREVLSRIMELFLDTRRAPLPVGGTDPRAVYVGACARRTRLRRALLEAKAQEISEEMARISKVLVEKSRDRERVIDELDSLKRRQANLSAEFEQEYDALVSKPHVERVETRGSYLHVYLSEMLVQHGGSQFTFGPYQVQLPLEGGRVYIHSDRPGLRRDGTLYHHPHIWNSGEQNNICYGAVASDVAKLVAEREYAFAIDMLIAFLHGFNESEERAVKILYELWRPLEKIKSCLCETTKTKRREQ